MDSMIPLIGNFTLIMVIAAYLKEKLYEKKSHTSVENSCLVQLFHPLPLFKRYIFCQSTKKKKKKKTLYIDFTVCISIFFLNHDIIALPKSALKI